MLTNLNNALIPCDEGSDEPLEDYSTSDGKISVYFRNLEDRLIEHIQQADLVVGCVAWLTNERILNALAQIKGVALVVQKEDFLRPDIHSRSNWTKKIRGLYQQLPEGPERLDYDNILCSLSTFGDTTIAPVRCVGNHNSDKSPAFPRAHHKFVVFCRYHRRLHMMRRYFRHRYESGSHYFGKYLENYGEAVVYGTNRYLKIMSIHPYAVWTGSFNFTANASLSLENALYITSPAIVSAYYHEWAQIEAISEPLDWETPWVEPQWRIGT